jgi:hypothetical protein
MLKFKLNKRAALKTFLITSTLSLLHREKGEMEFLKVPEINIV